MSCLMKVEEKNAQSPVLRPFYSSDLLLDDLLNEFHDTLSKDGIEFKVEGDQITSCGLKEQQFEHLLKEAFLMAKESLDHMDGNPGRFFKIKNQHAQKKEFIKISYSSDMKQNIQNIHYQCMEAILSKKSGFIQVECSGEENTIMIAVTSQGKN